jgi:hypothetical protein
MHPNSPGGAVGHTSPFLRLRVVRFKQNPAEKNISCGYSATNYDGSAAKRSKTLRPQFGNFYDGN